MEDLTERQKREIDYHKGHATIHSGKATAKVCFDVVQNPRRRWWNAYWSTYDVVNAFNLTGKRVLVVGCGFGEDAFRIASMGAEVHAFDISGDIIEITKQRARNFMYRNVDLKIMASENLNYPSDFFDYIFCLDILHHVDIRRTTEEFVRVIKSGGHIIGDELYTHNWMQRVRENFLVKKFLYPAMANFIYGGKTAYITEDEHKIDENDFSIIKGSMSQLDVLYFNIFIGRVIPDRYPVFSRIDRFLMIVLRGLGKYFAGRVVFSGTVIK